MAKRDWEKCLGGPPPAEYSLLELYDDAVEALKHYISKLERLHAVPQFGPQTIGARTAVATDAYATAPALFQFACSTDKLY